MIDLSWVDAPKGGAFRNWITCLLQTPRGQALFANLAYDMKARKECNAAVAEFRDYIERKSEYRGPLKKADLTNPGFLAIAANEVRGFCQTKPGAVPITRQAPQIDKNRFPSGKVRLSRIVSESNAIKNNLLMSKVGLRSKSAVSPAHGIRKTFRKSSVASAAKARAKKKVGSSVSDYWVQFFAFADDYELSAPKRFRHNDATWICGTLGLTYSPSDSLVRVVFALEDHVGHWRPTTFSAGGFEAFFAHDARNGFGLTMPTRGIRLGVREFVIAESRLPAVVDVDKIGTPDTDLSAEVNYERISRSLRTKIKNRSRL